MNTESTAAAGGAVYVVEDDRAVRESLELLLRLRGFIPKGFASGEEFLDYSALQRPACALLDVRLPGIDGLQLQRELRSRHPGLPTIVITAHGDVSTARTALREGAVDFLEKPIAQTVADARRVVATVRRTGRVLVIGYILRHHPSWQRFVDIARKLGKPLVMRMNLNQQSAGAEWETHKRLMDALPPIVDCGVHYVDMMCLMTRSRPIRVQAIGARLSDEIRPGMYNYGQLQVVFEDGSVGWYEAGWGPMMSETAFFVKDVIGPKGSVSIVMAESAGGQFSLRQLHGARAYPSSDPDTARVWWEDVGVHQNITHAVHPDPVSGMHCWHQKAVNVTKAGPNDRNGDIRVDTAKSMQVYREWLALTKPAPGPGGLRRPLWFKRPLKPDKSQFYIEEESKE